MIILADVSDQALTGRLLQIRKDERRLLVECLGCLAELDRRKTVLSLGYGSLFSFCTDFLSMTKASAFRRTTAARLLARFPVVADYLADGRLNLTTLVELRDVLDEAHLVEILDRAAGRTEDQVKELVASLRPQPAPADLLRRLPGPRNDSGGSGPVPPATNGPSAALAAPPAFLPPPVPARETAVQVGRPQAARLHPIAPEQHVLRVTVSAEFVASLEAARRALSHKLPGGELAEVLHEGLHAILANADRRRRGTGKKSSPSMPPPGSRYVPAAVRDEVWRRDGGQCAFIGSTGHRCTSRHQLQVHHLHAFALGGPPLAANLALRCRAHNLHAAEQDYGREHIAAKITARQARARSTPTPRPRCDGLGDVRRQITPPSITPSEGTDAHIAWAARRKRQSATSRPAVARAPRAVREPNASSLVCSAPLEHGGGSLLSRTRPTLMNTERRGRCHPDWMPV